MKIKDLSLRSINRALYSLWRKICKLTERVDELEEGGDGLQSIGEGDNVIVDNTDPLNPIVSVELPSIYVDNLSDISSVTDTNAGTIFVGNNVTGGEFTRYSGSYVDDGVVVITDANGQKWKRIVGDYINIRWFGAAPGVISGGGADIFSAFISALTAADSRDIISSPVIFIPSTGAGNKWYSCSNTITIVNKVKIFGEGPNSHIRFGSNIDGIITTYISSRGTELNNFQISAFVAGSPDYTKCGLRPNDIIYSDNLTIKEFPDGIQMIAAIPVGNVNNSIFNNLHLFQNRRHGAFIDGPDANNITFYNLDAVSNGGCGVFDSSFLGNHYYTPHFATNSSPTLPWQKGLVKHGGVVYQSLKDNNIGIEPGVTAGWATWWETNATIQVWSGYSIDWDIAKTYHVGGPYFMEGANQWGSMNNVYIEGDQPLATLSPRSSAIGGNPVHRGPSAMMRAFGNYLYTKDSFRVGNVPDNTTDVIVKLGSTVGGGVRGIGVTTINPAGVWLDYFPGTASFGQSMGGMKNQAGSSHLRFLTTGSSAVTTGRTTTPQANANLALTGPMYFTLTTSRVALRELDFHSGVNTLYAFSTVTKDTGDMVICSSRDADMLAGKLIEPIVGTKRWVGVKGYEEQLITNITGTYVFGRDYNIAVGRGILYDITFTGTSGTDDCVIQRRLLVKNTAGTLSIKNNQEIGTSLKDTSFATTDIEVAIILGGGNDDTEIRMINLPAGTNGKMQVKRINY